MTRRREKRQGGQGNARTQGVDNRAEPDGSALFFYSILLMNIPKEGPLLGEQ